MRVGLATWWRSPNYGTVLQAYALYHALGNIGCKAYIVTFHRRHFGWKDWIKIALSLVGVMQIRHWWIKKHAMSNRSNNANSQCGKNIPKYVSWCQSVFVVRGLKYPWSLPLLVAMTDCFVSGSDQIWNTFYKGFNPHMFLDCVGNAKRVAYSSSIGTKGVNPTYADEVKKWLSKYYRIGVREKTSVETLKVLTGREDIVQVLDPVFLLSAEEWREISRSVNMPELSECVVCYMLGDRQEYSEQIEQVKLQFGLNRVIVISSAECPGFNVQGRVCVSDLSPPEFIFLLDSASIVCTDSFHATCLSLILKKNFVVFKRFRDGDDTSQNSRIYDLLDMFGMREKIYGEGNNYGWRRQIDWDQVDAVIQQRKKFSMRFLETSILG